MPSLGSRKIVLIPDHYTADERANRNVDILREFAREQGIKYFYDITDRANFKANPGVCHIAPSKRVTPPWGNFVWYRFSHLQCWCFWCSRQVSAIQMPGSLWALASWIKVPATMRFVLDGEMPSYLLAKDLILQIMGILVLGDVSSNGICWENRSETNDGRADDAAIWRSRLVVRMAPLLPMKPHLSMSALVPINPLSQFTPMLMPVYRSPLRCFTIRAGCLSPLPDNRFGS